MARGNGAAMTMKRKSPFSIFIPCSILSDVPSLIEKTFKVGQIARAASIFRVDSIVLYRDHKRTTIEDGRLIKEILEYAETPQYLRKRLFPLTPSLKYAGLIPPLRTPHHPLASSKIGFRDGYVLKSSRSSSIVEIGLPSPVECPAPLTQGSRVTLRLEGGSWVPSSREEAPYYWGYSVDLSFKPLTDALKRKPPEGIYGGIIGTSRKGEHISDASPRLLDLLSKQQRLALLFGSPGEGLDEILSREGASLKDVADMTVNFAPDQGTATIRTEEAVIISLAALDAVGAANPK